MKRAIPVSLAVGLLAASGCVSTHLVNGKAKEHWERDAETGEDRKVAGQPGYYALLPFTAAADLVTDPFQMIFSGAPHSGWASIDGWPVPLP